MDKVTKAILSLIAAALCAIAFKLYDTEGPFAGSPTYGDLIKLRDIKNSEQHREARTQLIKRLPLVRVQGGAIDADVSGSVSIDN